MEKFCTSREAPDDNMAHAPSMVDNLGYKHSLVYVIFTDFSLQILLNESTRTQARTEEVEMKKKSANTKCILL